MEIQLALLEPVLSDVKLTTVFKVDNLEIEILPDSTKEVHVYGECISSEDPAEIYLHGDFRESELEEIQKTYSKGAIIKVSGDYRIFSGGHLIVYNSTTTALSNEAVSVLQVYFT